MKIAIISDTHDNTYNLRKTLAYIKERGVAVLLHAGDMTKAETLELIGNSFHGDIYVVGGNADLNNLEEVAKQYPLMNFGLDTLEVTLGSIKIAITHKPIDAKTLANSGKYNLVIHGHDHKPWQKIINNTELLNPGNVSDVRYPATFAIYDTETRKPSLVQLARI